LNALYGVSGRGHPWSIEYFLDNPEKWRKFFKFSVVRNPWDRLVSAFHFLKDGGRNAFDARFTQNNLHDCANLSQFLKKLQDPIFARHILRATHFRPQHHFLLGPSGHIEVDCLLKFETLATDYERLRRHIDGAAPTLSHFNRSCRRRYAGYYDIRGRRLVASLYADDIALFGYRFEDDAA